MPRGLRDAASTALLASMQPLLCGQHRFPQDLSSCSSGQQNGTETKSYCLDKRPSVMWHTSQVFRNSTGQNKRLMTSLLFLFQLAGRRVWDAFEGSLLKSKFDCGCREVHDYMHWRRTSPNVRCDFSPESASSFISLERMGKPFPWVSPRCSESFVSHLHELPGMELAIAIHVCGERETVFQEFWVVGWCCAVTWGGEAGWCLVLHSWAVG